jgi:hypothetical protein
VCVACCECVLRVRVRVRERGGGGARGLLLRCACSSPGSRMPTMMPMYMLYSHLSTPGMDCKAVAEDSRATMKKTRKKWPTTSTVQLQMPKEEHHLNQMLALARRPKMMVKPVRQPTICVMLLAMTRVCKGGGGGGTGGEGGARQRSGQGAQLAPGHSPKTRTLRSRCHQGWQPCRPP